MDTEDETLCTVDETIIQMERDPQNTVYGPTAQSTPAKSPLLNPVSNPTPPPRNSAVAGEPRVIGLYETIPPEDREANSQPSASNPLANEGDSTSRPAFAIQLSRDPLTLSKGNLAHLIAADCVLSSTISRTLLDLGYINPETLRANNPTKGQVVVTKIGSRYIFSIAVRENHFDITTTEDLYKSMTSLKVALREVGARTVALSRVDDGLNKLPANAMRNTLNLVFGDSDIAFSLCTREVQVPPQEHRRKIIREYHARLVGGHKGITKTYRRIRGRFIWPGMNRDIQDFIRACRSCQMKKLVRIKTRQPMIITDTRRRIRQSST